MTNPFTFKYPPVLVAWFAALADRLREVSPQSAEGLSQTAQMLKSGERMPEGLVREVVFTAHENIYPYSKKDIRLALSADGFSVKETLRDQSVRGACIRFSWDNVECAVRRRYIENDAGHSEEIKEMRGACSLESCLDGLVMDRLADASVEVREVRKFQVSRNASELGRVLSDLLTSGSHSCLQSRDGAIKVKVSRNPDGGAIIAENKVTGEVVCYSSVSDLVSSVLPGLFARGVRVYPCEG